MDPQYHRDVENSLHSSHTASIQSNANKEDIQSTNEKVGDSTFFENKPENQVKTTDKLRNPLYGIPKAQLMAHVEAFAIEKGLTESLSDLKKGALIAQDPGRFETLDELSEEDKEIIRREKTHRWHQPKTLYWMTSQYIPAL